MVTVGIDIGTTSVKAVAADADGTVLARARVPHAINSPSPGTFEHDLDQAWRGGVLEALAQVVEGAGAEVEAVNVSAMVPSLGAVDAEGRALSPGLLYGDRRGASEANDPNEPGDNGEVEAFLGWLTAHAPDAAGYWPAQAVANHALTGIGAIDGTAAITAHPLHDYRDWDAERAAAAGASVDQLPQVIPGHGAVGRVLDGLPAAGALVGAGTIDALGEQMVAGANEIGDVLVIFGTTLITWAVIDDWVTVPGLWTLPHTAPGKVLIGGPSTAGGMFIDRVGRWLAPVERADLEALDPEALPVWLPYVRGERCPLHRPDLRAELHDAGLQHGPAALRWAAYEATGFVIRRILDLGGAAPRRIVATGGGTRSEGWMQAVADVTGLPIDVVAVPEGAALGAAFMARQVAGIEDGDGGRWARTARRVEPDERWIDPCSRRYERFRELSP